MKNKRKTITYILLLVVPLVIIYWSISKANLTNKNNNITPTTINNLQIDNSKFFYLNNNITNLNWEDNRTDYKETINYFVVEETKAENEIKNILNYYKIDPDKYEEIESNNKIWRSTDKIILLNNEDNKIDISYELNSTTKKGFIQEQLINQARKIIDEATDIPYLELNTIEYYIDDNLESEKGKMEESKIAKVGFIQKLPNSNFKVIPKNFSSNNSIVVTIDSLLQTRYISIHSTIKNMIPSNTQQIVTLNKEKINPSLLHRITPFDISDEIKIENSKSTSFLVKKVEIAYTQLENRLVPVFLISGDLYIDEKLIGTASYVTPSTSLESL